MLDFVNHQLLELILAAVKII